MKVVIGCILLVALCCQAQNKKLKHGDIALFNKGLAVYELIDDGLYLNSKIESIDTTTQEGISRYREVTITRESVLEKALEYFTELIEEYPKSKLFFRALNNKAQLEYELKDYDEARITYKKILESKADDRELGGVGQGIMSEPYANYKNRACMRLAEIEYGKGNYNESIKYLTLTEKYPYQHFCGNAFAEEKIEMAMQFAKNYVKLGQNRKALEQLMPHILSTGLADNEEITMAAAAAFNIEFGTRAKLVFDESIKTLYLKKEKEGNNFYDTYYINLFDTEIPLDQPFGVFAATPDEEKAMMYESLKNSHFNKLLNN